MSYRITRNAFKADIVGEYSDTDTIIELSSVTGLPDPSVVGNYNVILYDTLFGNPADARNGGSYEIWTVTDITGNDLTVIRGQEDTTAITIGDRPFAVLYGATSGWFEDVLDDIDSKIPISDIVDNLTSEDTDKPLSANQGKALQDTKVSKTSATGGALIPAGTTAQRDSEPPINYLRYNTTTEKWEYGDGIELVPEVEIPNGKVLQVVFAETSTPLATSSDSFVNTNLEGKITPKSKDSTIYIYVDQQVYLQSARGRLRLREGTTQIGNQVTLSINSSATFDDFMTSFKRKHIHDSESELTYTTQILRDVGTAVGCQRLNDTPSPSEPTTSTMLLIEIEPE